MAQSQGRSASVLQDKKSAFDAKSPTVKPEGRRMSKPVAIKSESPASIEPNTPVSMPSLTPQPTHQDLPEVPKLDPSKSLRPPEHGQAYLPQYTMAAFGNDFNPFAPAPPHGFYDNPSPNPPLEFGSDPLMSMSMAGGEAFGAPFDNVLHNPYSEAPREKLGVDVKGQMEETLSGGVVPSQLDLSSFEYNPGAGESLKAGSVARTPEKWSEWIEPERWERTVQ